MRIPALSATIRLLPALLWMLLIFVLSAQHQRPGPRPQPVAVPPTPGTSTQPTQDLFDILGHFGVYAVLAACLWWALGLVGHLPRWGRLVLAFTGSVIFALTDEWHQSYVAGRQESVFDLQVDMAGALGALAVIALVQWTISRHEPST